LLQTLQKIRSRAKAEAITDCSPLENTERVRQPEEQRVDFVELPNHASAGTKFRREASAAVPSKREMTPDERNLIAMPATKGFKPEAQCVAYGTLVVRKYDYGQLGLLRTNPVSLSRD
jgi:hypothetical protein